MSTIADRVPSLKQGILIEWLSVAWMVLEAVVAIVAGVLAHSVALVAYGADSIIELVAGAAVLARLYVEMRGGDEERVESAERTASWIVGLALLALAVYIVVASVASLVSRSRPETSALGIGIAAASSIIMPILASAKKRIGRVCSKALVSDGSCSMVCAYMSWILLIGVGATALFGWWWIDSIAALGFTWLVAKEGLEAVKDARGADSGRESESDFD